MPRINVQGYGIVEFPDDMSDDAIAAAIENELPKPVSAGTMIDQAVRRGGTVPGITARMGAPGPVIDKSVRIQSSPWEQAVAKQADEAFKKQAAYVPKIKPETRLSDAIATQAKVIEAENAIDPSERPADFLNTSAAVGAAVSSAIPRMDTNILPNRAMRVKAALLNAEADNGDELAKQMADLSETERQAVMTEAAQLIHRDFAEGVAQYVPPSEEGEPGLNTAMKSLSRTVLGLAAPQAIVEMGALGGAGKIVEAGANAMRVAPFLRRAAAQVGAAAVPGAAAVYTGANAISQAADGLNAKSDTERIEKLTSAVTSALMSAGLFGAASGKARTAAAEFPQPGTYTGRRMRATDSVLKEHGLAEEPSRVPEPLAAEVSSELRSRGSNLAASEWDAVGTDTTKVKLGDVEVTVKPIAGRRPAAQVVAPDGSVLFGGSPESVRLWLNDKMGERPSTTIAVAPGSPVATGVGAEVVMSRAPKAIASEVAPAPKLELTAAERAVLDVIEPAIGQGRGRSMQEMRQAVNLPPAEFDSAFTGLWRKGVINANRGDQNADAMVSTGAIQPGDFVVDPGSGRPFLTASRAEDAAEPESPKMGMVVTDLATGESLPVQPSPEAKQDLQDRAAKIRQIKLTPSGRVMEAIQANELTTPLSALRESTGLDAPEFGAAIQKLASEGRVELVPVQEDYAWTEESSKDLIEDSTGQKFYAVKPTAQGLVKPISGRRRKLQKGAVNFFTGWKKETLDPAPRHQWKDPETERRYREAAKPTEPRKVEEDNRIVQMFRVNRHLPEGKYPELAFKLSRFRKASAIGQNKAFEAVRRNTWGLSPNEYDAFSRKLFADDAKETVLQFVEDGLMKAPISFEEIGGGMIRVPMDRIVEAQTETKSNAVDLQASSIRAAMEGGQSPTPIQGIYNEADGRIASPSRAQVRAYQAAGLSHVDVKLENLEAMKADRDKQSEPIRLAFNMDYDSVMSNHADITDFVSKLPSAQAAAQRRAVAIAGAISGYTKWSAAAGYPADSKFQRKDYFRRRVLEHIDAKAAAGAPSGVNAPTGRSFLKSRKVNDADYSTNYIESEYEVLQQLITDTEKFKLLAYLKDPSNKLNIIQTLKDKARADNTKAVIEHFAKKGMSASDVFTVANWRRYSLIDILGELAASEDLPAPPEFEHLRTELADAYVDAVAESRRMKLQSTASEFAPYVRWIRENASGDEGSARRRTIESLAKPARISDQMIKDILADRLLTWADYIPDTHRPWAPEEGNMFYSVRSIREQLAIEAFEAAGEEVGLTKDDIRTVKALKSKSEPLVVPKEVAATMDDMRTTGEKAWAYKAGRAALGFWKKMQLVTPWRFIKYKIRNASGDAEATLSGNPKAFRKVPQAVRELWNWYKLRQETPDLMAWMDAGGFQSGVTINELQDLRNEKHFERLMQVETGKISGIGNPWKFWFEDVAQPTNEFTEGILRYANFLEYLDQMKRGGGRPENFGASRREDVMALSSLTDRAYKLSNDLIGAYDELSSGGKLIRDQVIPFWSFQEVNFKRLKWLTINAARDQKLTEMVGRKLLAKVGVTVVRSPLIAMRLGRLYLMMLGAWGVYNFFNQKMFPDAEASLPKDVRATPHVILGNQGNNVRVFTRLGNVPDFMEWLDPLDYAPVWNDYVSGRRSAGDTMLATLKHVGVSFGEKMATGAVPWFTVPLQAATGSRWYPDITKPRMIRDRAEYVAEQLHMKPVYQYLAGKPMGPSGERWAKMARTLVWYEYDPKESAYYDTLDIRREYFRKQGKEDEGGAGSRSALKDSLYNMKVSIRKQDPEAFRRYMIRFYDLGGTEQQIKKSAETFDPLYKMKKADRREFIDSLNAEEKKRLFMAQQYFEETFGSGRLEEYLQQNSDLSRRSK